MSTNRKGVVTVIAPPSLLAWREANQLDQREAARYLEISQPYYSRLELGQQAPRPAIAKRVTERTGVRLETLLGIAS